VEESYNSRPCLPLINDNGSITATGSSQKRSGRRAPSCSANGRVHRLRDYLGNSLEPPEDWTPDEAGAVDDLLAIVSADYNSAATAVSGEQATGIARTFSRYPELMEGVRIESGDVRLNGRDIVVRLEPYTRGAGLHLWGFSCDLKTDHGKKFLIYLNTAHQRGAVAATLTHEFAHYVLWKVEGVQTPHNEGPLYRLSKRLRNSQELVCDSAVSLLAMSQGSIRRRHSCKSNSKEAHKRDIADSLDAIRPEYRMFVKSERIPFEWHVRYLTTTLHLFKLRRALAGTLGI